MQFKDYLIVVVGCVGFWTFAGKVVEIISSALGKKKVNVNKKICEFETRLTKMEASDKQILDLVVGLYEDRLSQLCEYHLKEGEISMNDLKKVRRLYHPLSVYDDKDGEYKALVSRVESLPIKK